MKTVFLLISLSLATAALAQGDPACAVAKAKPFWVAAGYGSQTSSNASDYTKRQSLALSAGYYLGIPCKVAPGKGMPGLNLNYFQTAGNGNRITNMGVTAGPRIFLDQKMSVYGGFGVGVYSTSMRTAGTTGGSARPSRLPNAGESRTFTRFGSELMMGWRAPQGYFVEGAYHMLGKRQGVTADYFTLSVGVHF